ncbi:MAG: DUF899 domain-containing protein [bacterium]|nr:DUF899 domain-containing protein [bacterium]
MIGRYDDESAAYAAARDELLRAELALRDQRERVAELRRALPLDQVVPDYELERGPHDLAADKPVERVRLSELFEQPDKPLVLYHFMFGGMQERPCPMCTLWADGFDGINHQASQSVNFGLVARAPIGDFRSWARRRKWTNLRLLSSGTSGLKPDLHFETEDGRQLPGVSVFMRGANGEPRHFYSASAILAEGEYRGIDLLSPVWHLLDLTPEGRGEWLPSFEYARR